ncbi:primosomal protein N' [Arachidicoccus ginsenosidivorans]|nr:primosomal protein N' [Arachidicoccus ginsenosidivorans]
MMDNKDKEQQQNGEKHQSASTKTEVAGLHGQQSGDSHKPAQDQGQDQDQDQAQAPGALADLFESANAHKQRLYAEIIIPLHLPRNYTWEIPDYLMAAAAIGLRCEVSLRNKKYTGIIKNLFKVPPKDFTPLPIYSLLDKAPIVTAVQLKFWEWIADYYQCSEGDVMQAAVPSNFKLSSESIIRIEDEFADDVLAGGKQLDQDLSDEEFLLAEALQIRGELRFPEIQQILEGRKIYPVVKKLIDRGLCYIEQSLKEKYKEKKAVFIRFHPDYQKDENLEPLLNNWKGAPAQLKVLMLLRHMTLGDGDVMQSALLKKAATSLSTIKALLDKKMLVAERRSVTRLPVLAPFIEMDFSLSAAQKSAFDLLVDLMQQKKVNLLHGVTASGKTHLYLKLMEQALSAGKQVLYMLPEIALTAQIIRRLQHHFGGHVAVYHSRFNPNERVELWEKVLQGEVQIIVGARSALLLPFKDLGLIIVDEEHDSSYKQQDPAPRYHARDAAIYYGALFEQCPVLLGSATPSLESYYNASQGKYGLVTLLERFENVAMPVIELDNLNMIPKEIPRPILISPELETQIQEALKAQKQVILFQNRRGYSPYQICNSCGWIPQCKHCAVSLTYHKGRNKLVCHYCGTEYPLVTTCAACGSHDFQRKKFGTEQIEEAVAALFPKARVARMDYDSVKGKFSHDAMIQLFESRKIDILIGTQMVVKGLDFEHVSLVGILDADGLLNFADFRVGERAFQLMEQVSGRAGRKDGKGKVLIQVSNIHHPVLQYVQQHDYLAMYQEEIQHRKAFKYPPFTRLIRLIFKHRDTHTARQAAERMAQALRQLASLEVLGPATAPIERVRGQYLWEILIKVPKQPGQLQRCKKVIDHQRAILQSIKEFARVQIAADVDPA